MVRIGKWAFLVGILIAIFSGLLSTSASSGYIAVVLIALGLVVGFLNISDKDSERFLIATISLLIIGTVSVNALFASGSFAGQVQIMLNNFISFVSAAALVVALKAVISMGTHDDKKDK